MLRQMVTLWQLRKMDEATKSIDERLQAVPDEVSDMERNVKRLETLLVDERNALDEARGLLSRQQGELSESNQLVSRVKAKGAQAKNAKEVQAAERELDMARRSAKDREEEIQRLNVAIEDKEKSLGERESKLEGLKNVFEEEQGKATEQLGDLRTRREAADAGRGDLTDKLPATILRRYERVRGARGSAVAEVVDGTCMGCRVRIPPQMHIELLRTETLYQCPNCLRFLLPREVLEGQGIAEAAASDP